MTKLFFDWLNTATTKILSARFLITVAIGFTYCHIVWHAVHFFLKSMMSQPDRMESFATGLMTGFAGTAMFIFKAYFDRTDRPDPTQTTQTTPATEVKP